jgi:uncharacterized membrane protein (DUF485 family)
MPDRSDQAAQGDGLSARTAQNRPREAETLEALAARRSRIATVLTATMLVVYFGFILLVAFAKGFLGRSIAEGLSVGILLGVLVILATWVCTWIYVRWANRSYEPALDRLRR